MSEDQYNGWLDISSAPTGNAEHVDVWVKVVDAWGDEHGFRVPNAYWSDGHWCIARNGIQHRITASAIEGERYTITHWRPLPLPPFA